MKIFSILAEYALGVSAAAAILSGCGASGSPSTFFPSEATPQSLRQAGANAQAQGRVSRYQLSILDSLGGTNSFADSIDDKGWIAGESQLRRNKVYHAALWRAGRGRDLGTLGGPNSTVFYPVKNDVGEISGASEVSATDPNAENFCGFGTTHECRGFRWQNGAMKPLSTLGGNNGYAGGANNHRQVVGYGETNTQDPSCHAPQIFDYDGEIWQPNGKVVTLQPYSGDTVSSAFGINDSGDAVGTSGLCGPFPSQYSTVHALLWKSGSIIDLGNLGDTANNVAIAINNRGQIVGYAGVVGKDKGELHAHAFLWQKGKMHDLGTLRGDYLSIAYGINDLGQVVGESCDVSNNCRAFIWQNGSMTDLNLLVPPTKVDLLYGTDVNDSGQIAAGAYDLKNNMYPAVVLIPGKKATVIPLGAPAPRPSLPESVRTQLRRYESAVRPFANL
jgi:probable HAF family extracellular repeat protein